MLSRRLVLAFATVAILGGTAGAGAQAPAPVSVTTFVVTGRGWGHGVGMSQWGAYGYAEQGVSYERILQHFYPGTELKAAAPASVRVLLAEGRRRVTITSPVRFRVRDGTGTVRDLAAGRYTFGSALRLALGSGSRRQALPGPLIFMPGSQPLSLDRPYRGTLLVGVSGRTLNVVNRVGVEAYLRGVVSAEMPRDWPLEAVKAQAVAARSYALSRRGKGSFDLYADTRDQVYGGLEVETPTGSRAVAETRRQVLLFDGKIASAYYFSTSGGRTAALPDAFPSEKPIPYLVSVPDPWDKLSPYHVWGPVVVSAARAARSLGIPGLTGLRPVPASGRARMVVATGRRGDVTVPASDVRSALGLRSTWFRFGVLTLSRPAGTVRSGAAVTITGRVQGVSDVDLEQRLPGGDWQPVAALAPGADGSFSLEVAPTVTTRYRLAAPGVRGGVLRVIVSPVP